MQNDLTPNYLRSLVPATVGSASSYPLRNANNLQTVRANSQLYYYSVLPSTVRDWNELPEQTHNLQTLNISKYRLNANLSKPPSYYNVGKRIDQIYHARLRTSSSLRQHLSSKNIIVSPVCVCGSIDIFHF